MAYEFHYTPTGTGVISGKEVLEQTEDAINDLGNTAISGVQEALDKAEQALTNSENAVDDAQTALNTANNAEGVAIQAQNDVSNLSGTVTNIGNRVTTAEGNIGNLQGRMTTAEGNITNLQGRMTTAEGNIGNLQTAVSTAQATANSAQQTATTARQQSYVFRYSSTALTASSTNSNTLLDNTDNLKVGDKVIDSSGVLFSITAIDTQNSTFTIGTALVDLAQDSDVVHKSGDETVGGIKTFSETPYIYNSDSTGTTPNIVFKNSKYVVGDTTNTGEQRIIYADKNNAWSGSISCNKNVAGTQYLAFVIYTTDNNNANLSSTINYYLTKNGDRFFTPYEDNLINLGVNGRRWKSVYATNYYYGSNSVEFSTKFVTTDTAQTISGNKTFSSNVNVYNSDNTANVPNLILKNSIAERGTGTSTQQIIYFTDKNDTSLGYINCGVTASAISQMSFRMFDTNNQSNGFSIRKSTSATTIQPIIDNTVNLGTTTAKWSDVQTYKVNNLEPSSLSLPNIANKIDISSYITDLTGAPNIYVSPSNGYINLRSTNADILGIVENTSGMGTISRGNNQTIAVYLPVVANSSISLYAKCTSLAQAYFIPCQGNV